MAGKRVPHYIMLPIDQHRSTQRGPPPNIPTTFRDLEQMLRTQQISIDELPREYWDGVKFAFKCHRVACHLRDANKRDSYVAVDLLEYELARSFEYILYYHRDSLLRDWLFGNASMGDWLAVPDRCPDPDWTGLPPTDLRSLQALYPTPPPPDDLAAGPSGSASWSNTVPVPLTANALLRDLPLADPPVAPAMLEMGQDSISVLAEAFARRFDERPARPPTTTTRHYPQQPPQPAHQPSLIPTPALREARDNHGVLSIVYPEGDPSLPHLQEQRNQPNPGRHDLIGTVSTETYHGRHVPRNPPDGSPSKNDDGRPPRR